MKRIIYLFCFFFIALTVSAQDKLYANYEDMIADRGDVATTIAKIKRKINQIYLSGGADYEIYSTSNKEMTKYLKKRCYAVKLNDTLYVNCRQLKYKKYRFGNWYSVGEFVKGNVFFRAQPLGQIATSTLLPKEHSKLGGSVGDAINASGLVSDRVYYMINPETGNADFVGKEKMTELLKDYPNLLEDFSKEESESADVIGKYLSMIK